MLLLLFSGCHIQLSATPNCLPLPWTAAPQASSFFTISRSLLKLMSIESMMPSNHHILCRPVLLLPLIFPSIRVFYSEPALHIRWPKYSWGFNISPSSEHSGLISFRKQVRTASVLPAQLGTGILSKEGGQLEPPLLVRAYKPTGKHLPYPFTASNRPGLCTGHSNCQCSYLGEA